MNLSTGRKLGQWCRTLTPDWALPLYAALAALLLTLPGFGFAYLFDDYNFLIGTLKFRPELLLPDPGAVLYRPISRELYFGLLNRIFSDSPVGAHVVNASLMAGIVVLGASLTARLAGRRAGLVAGILFAGFAPWPVLVAWISGCQDLFAIFFLLVALHFEHRGRSALALISFAVAVLSKETTVFVAPALVMIAWIGSHTGSRTRATATRVGALLVAWALIHPGIRVLLSFGGASPPGGYIGFDNPERWQYLLRSIPVLLNLPLTGYPTPWFRDIMWALGLAAIPLGIATWGALRHRAEGNYSTAPVESRAGQAEIALFGVLLAVPPLLLTSLLVQHWAPYYVCFAAVGAIIAVSPWAAALPSPILGAFLATYLVAGFWSRGVEIEPGLPTERGLAPAGKALARLERNFKRVAPSLPPSCVVYVTTMATGAQSVYIHLHNFQVLRAWYHDPGIQALRPELRVVTSSPEVLFGVEPSLDVLLINPGDLTVRSTRGPEARQNCRNVLTAYAIGLAMTDDTEHAVKILSRLSAPDTWNHVADLRIAATLLIARGQRVAAAELVKGLPQFPPEIAINHVGLLLTVPTRGVTLEDAAIDAFGLPANDPRVYRFLLRGLMQLGYDKEAVRLAERLLELLPGDPEGKAAMAKADARLREAAYRIMPAIERLKFPWE